MTTEVDSAPIATGRHRLAASPALVACGGAHAVRLRRGGGTRHHGHGDARIRLRLGSARRRLVALDRPAATLGGGSRRAHGPRRCSSPDLAPGPAALQALGWVWPPALLALVVWMIPPRPQAVAKPQPPVAAVPRLRVSGRWRRSEALSRRHRDRSHARRAAGGRSTGRRRRPPALPPVHRFGQPCRRPGGGARRKLFRLDRRSRRRSPPRRGSAATTVPAAAGARALLSQPSHPDRERPADAAEPGGRAGALRRGRPFAGRRVRARLRAAVSGSGRGPRAARLDEPVPVHERGRVRRLLQRHASSVRRASVARPPRHRADRRLRRKRRTRLPRGRRRDPAAP